MNRNTMMARVSVSLVMASGLLACIASDAMAIPAFARKYNLSCTTCHQPAPRLKAYGEEFAANGFRLPGDEEPPRAYRNTGDELLTLQRDLPLAVRFDAFATFETEGEDALDLKTPWGLKLLSGGSVAPDIGYYFYFYLSERGEVAGVEDAYVHFNDIGGVPLDVMVGQFQISDPMMKRELRLSYEDYLVYKMRPGDSGTNLTYDRGVMVAYDTPFGLGVVGEVVNGNGKGAADETTRRFDSDTNLGYAARLVYATGPVTVGGFYYATDEDFEAGGSNEVEIWGPDLGLELGPKGALRAQFLHRSDSSPLVAGTARDVETDGLVAEFVVQPGGPDAKDSFVLLYNWIDSDLNEGDVESWTVSWSHLRRRNLRTVAEFEWDVDLEEARWVLGFSSAF